MVVDEVRDAANNLALAAVAVLAAKSADGVDIENEPHLGPLDLALKEYSEALKREHERQGLCERIEGRSRGAETY